MKTPEGIELYIDLAQYLAFFNLEQALHTGRGVFSNLKSFSIIDFSQGPKHTSNLDFVTLTEKKDEKNS